jgi:hypothetical protein
MAMRKPEAKALTMASLPTDIRMVRRVGSYEYREASKSEVRRRLAADRIVFEGVDGDEAANTVTYWYRPGSREDD